MALINCPECEKQISDQAENCPECGYPVNKDESAFLEENNSTTKAPPPQVVVKSKEGCFLQTLNIGCMILAVFIVLIILFFIAVFR